VRELDSRECWERLQADDFGRIALAPQGEPAIFPINYVVEQGRIVLRTSPGAKLTALLLDARVAFEIDGREDDSAWSVVVVGTAQEVELPPRLEAPETQERPWVPGPRKAVVEITPERVTGRLFTRSPAAPSDGA
jgi:nitroimidazol reductase NimA-like FMN-containing flavoprotein (pyridoxamine 5'-phosphate oxidase superfamily)